MASVKGEEGKKPRLKLFPREFLASLPPKRRRAVLLAAFELLVVLLLVLIIGWEGPIGRFFKSFSSPVVREISLEGINSPYCILVQAKGGVPVARSWSEERIYPASLTKVMTALVAIEKISSLQDTCVLEERMFEGLYEADASMAGFEVGERVKAIDLLYGALLPSGAECTNALAVMASGSVESFLDAMNRKAPQLGMKESHFVNTCGLQDEEHYSTCKDMAILMRVAIRNRTLRGVLETPVYTTDPTPEHPEGITFYSTLFQNLPDPEVTAGEILGGKTGYTNEAGLCLASFARVAGREYILVTAGAPANGYPLHVYDAETLFDRVGRKALELGYPAQGGEEP